MFLYQCFSFPFLLPSSLSKSNEKMSLGEDKKKMVSTKGIRTGCLQHLPQLETQPANLRCLRDPRPPENAFLQHLLCGASFPC